MDTLVSIIIPVFNRPELIFETLESVICQTYSNWECIIVDDGSTDNTYQLLEAYSNKDKRISVVKRPRDRPKGANACRNYGFELSKGKYINWFDSDDLMHPKKLELQIKALKNSELPLCVCQTKVFEEFPEQDRGLRHPRLKSDNFWEDYLMFKILWLTQAPLWEKEFLLEMDNLFDEELQAAQEWEFHLRALAKIKNYAVLDEPLVFLRLHKDSISKSNREEVLWNYFLARFKIYNNFKSSLSSRSVQFLQRYFLNSYKEALRNSQMTLGWKILKKHIIQANHLSLISRLRLSLGYLSFLIFKRGDILISYIN